MSQITIAIDGHSSTGKSTVAKALANRLNYVYVDTGAMYRAVAFFALSENMVRENRVDKEKLIAKLDDIHLKFRKTDGQKPAHIFLNGEDIESEIRSLEVAKIVSEVAAISQVRSKLVLQQQQMGKSGGVVMDGRDIGTVVFPDAELKIFMTASADVRARRRFDELQAAGKQASYDEVYANIVERDHIDSTRQDSPLRQAADAVLVDTSTMDREEQLELLYDLALKKGA